MLWSVASMGPRLKVQDWSRICAPCLPEFAVEYFGSSRASAQLFATYKDCMCSIFRYVVLTQGLRLHNQGLSCQHSTPTQHGSSNASLTKYVACPSSTASPTLYPLLCANFTNIRFHQLPKCITKNIPGAVGFLVIVMKREQGLWRISIDCFQGEACLCHDTPPPVSV